MSSNRKVTGFGGRLALALVMAILSYLITLTIIGPILIAKIGALYTKAFGILIASVVFNVFLGSAPYENNHESRIVPKSNRLSGGKPKRKFLLLFFAAMSFLMAPFGFAGVLASRGHGYLPPVWGGTICLISGIFLLYSFFRGRE
jgi:hypothetical protein